MDHRSQGQSQVQRRGRDGTQRVDGLNAITRVLSGLAGSSASPASPDLLTPVITAGGITPSSARPPDPRASRAARARGSRGSRPRRGRRRPRQTSPDRRDVTPCSMSRISVDGQIAMPIPMTTPVSGEDDALAEHHAEDLHAAGADRDADADLARPAADDVGEHAVDADRGERRARAARRPAAACR